MARISVPFAGGSAPRSMRPESTATKLSRWLGLGQALAGIVQRREARADRTQALELDLNGTQALLDLDQSMQGEDPATKQQAMQDAIGRMADGIESQDVANAFRKSMLVQQQTLLRDDRADWAKVERAHEVDVASRTMDAWRPAAEEIGEGLASLDPRRQAEAAALAESWQPRLKAATSAFSPLTQASLMEGASKEASRAVVAATLRNSTDPTATWDRMLRGQDVYTLADGSTWDMSGSLSEEEIDGLARNEIQRRREAAQLTRDADAALARKEKAVTKDLVEGMLTGVLQGGRPVSWAQDMLSDPTFPAYALEDAQTALSQLTSRTHTLLDADPAASAYEVALKTQVQRATTPEQVRAIQGTALKELGQRLSKQQAQGVLTLALRRAGEMAQGTPELQGLRYKFSDTWRTDSEQGMADILQHGQVGTEVVRLSELHPSTFPEGAAAFESYTAVLREEFAALHETTGGRSRELQRLIVPHLMAQAAQRIHEKGTVSGRAAREIAETLSEPGALARIAQLTPAQVAQLFGERLMTRGVVWGAKGVADEIATVLAHADDPVGGAAARAAGRMVNGMPLAAGGTPSQDDGLPARARAEAGLPDAPPEAGTPRVDTHYYTGQIPFLQWLADIESTPRGARE